MSTSSSKSSISKAQQFKKPPSSERPQRLQVNNTNGLNTNIQSASSQQQSQQKQSPQPPSQMTTNTRFPLPPPTQSSGMRPLLISGVPGDGLWCQVKEDSSSRYAAMAEKFVEKKTKQAESKVESALVEVLEKECADLGREAMRDKGRITEQNIEIAQMKKVIDNLSIQTQEQSTEIMHLRNSKRNLEDQLEKTKEGYNYLKRDINKAQSDSNSESQKAEDLRSIYVELKKQFEEYKASMAARVKDLEENLEEALEENDEIKGNLQLKNEIAERIDLERLKLFEAKDEKTQQESEKRLEKMSKLVEENTMLTDKLNESETYRRKFKEKNALLEKQLKTVQNERDKIEAVYLEAKKRNNDLSVLKSSNNKILDERIKSLTKENEELINQNKTLTNQLNRVKKLYQNATNQLDDQEEQEELEEVAAKPFLFGPIDNGRF